jgi:gliding motility associated protien GldN
MNILRSYRIVASAALVFAGTVAFAQQNPSMVDQTNTQFRSNEGVTTTWAPSLVTDGVYDRVPHVTNPLNWAPVRENDIMWKKRVWREIDTRQKQNMAFRYPGDEYTGGGYFIEILFDAIKKGKIKAYSNMDDRFTSALSKEQIMEILVGRPDTNYVEDPLTGEQRIVITQNEFNPDIVTKYRIKEDWIFDRNLGRMQARIIGIAPIRDIYNEDNSYRGSQAVFWLYYPEIREMLAQYEVFNPENDVARMTWDDYFEGRFFSSRIIKTSNPFDLTFQQRGMSNMEALYEAEKATEMLFNKEHDMWVY